MRILLTPKSEASINACGWMTVWEGAIRSGKTVASIIAWLRYVIESDENIFFMSGKTYASLIRNVIDGEYGLISVATPFARMTKDRSGATVVMISSAKGPKKIHLFGASDETLPYAYSYLQIYAAGTVPYMLATGLNPYINAQGFARKGMQTVFIGAVSNIILDPVMIFGLGLGIRGAAIATVLSQLLSMGCALRFLYSGQAELQLSLLKPRELDLPLVSNITGLGFSNFVMQFTNSLVAVVCNHVLSGYGGDIAVSVYTIVSSVRQIMDVPLLAVSNGSGPVLSYNYGARRPGRLKEAIRIICRLGVAYTVLSWLLILTFPEFFIRIFSSDPELISHAVPALHIYFFAFIFQVFQYCAQSVFKSLNMKYRAIFFSLFRKVVLVVPLTLILPRIGGLGAKGVYMAEPISNALGGMASFTTMMFTVYLRLGNEEV